MSKPEDNFHFPLYPEKLLVSTAEMTHGEFGAYVRLLCYQFMNKGIRPDRHPITYPGNEWEEIKHKFILCKDGRLRNPYLEKVRDGVIEKRKQLSEAGSKAASMRWHSDGNATDMPVKDKVKDKDKEKSKDIQEIVDLLAQILPSFKFKLNDSRKASFRARGKELKTLADWEGYFNTIKNTPFLHGDNDRGWKANIDWILKPANMAKVLEGVYQKSSKPGSRRIESPKGKYDGSDF